MIYDRHPELQSKCDKAFWARGYYVSAIGSITEDVIKKYISKRENMRYDEAADTYTCYAEKKLRAVAMRKQKSKSGYQSEVTIYECEDCRGCPYKEKCTKAKGNKRLYLSKNFLKKRQESYENILSEKGIKYRMNRSIQVEGAFGV